jgi:hypothetical protein
LSVRRQRLTTLRWLTRLVAVGVVLQLEADPLTDSQRPQARGPERLGVERALEQPVVEQRPLERVGGERPDRALRHGPPPRARVVDAAG